MISAWTSGRNYILSVASLKYYATGTLRPTPVTVTRHRDPLLICYNLTSWRNQIHRLTFHIGSRRHQNLFPWWHTVRSHVETPYPVSLEARSVANKSSAELLSHGGYSNISVHAHIIDDILFQFIPTFHHEVIFGGFSPIKWQATGRRFGS